MICIFLANPTLGLDAGEVQAAVEAQLAPLEHGPVEERPDGRFDIQLRIENEEEMLRRLAAERGTSLEVARAVFSDEQPSELVKVGESRVAGPRQVYISESLDGVTLDNFLPGRSFGNGVTLCGHVALNVGGVKFTRIISWCIFPNGTTLTQDQRQTLRRLFEG